jgi:hypothetical protein
MAHGGIHAYASSYPQVTYQVFFVSLIVLDPLVIVLAAAVRREAAWLACGVMAANWAGTGTDTGHGCLSRYEVRGVGVGAVPEQASGAHAWHEITPACTSRTRSRAGSGNQ